MLFDIYLNPLISYRCYHRTMETLRAELNELRDNGYPPLKFVRVIEIPLTSSLISPTNIPIQKDDVRSNDYDGSVERLPPIPLNFFLYEVSFKECLEAIGEKFHEPE